MTCTIRRLLKLPQARQLAGSLAGVINDLGVSEERQKAAISHRTLIERKEAT